MAHNFSSVLENHNEDINICISKFDINIDNYSVFTPKELNIKGDDSNKVYIKGNKLPPPYIHSANHTNNRSNKWNIAHDESNGGCNYPVQSPP